MILKQMAKKIAARLNMSVMSFGEAHALRALRAKFSGAEIDNNENPLVVAVEGIIGMKLIAIYYVMLLLILRNKTKRQVNIVLFVTNQRDAYFVASRIYKLFFPTTIVVINRALTKAEADLVEEISLGIESQINDGEDLFRTTYQGIRLGRDIYYAYLRRFLIGSLDQKNEHVGQLIREAVRNVIVARKIVSRFQPEMLLITDNCYATFSPYFHVFLQEKISVALTVTHSPDSGKICGRVYQTLEDTEAVNRRYPFSFDDATWKDIREHFNAVEEQIILEYLSMRFSGQDTSFNGEYHRSTDRMKGSEIRRKLSLPEADTRKVVLIAAHLFWDDPGYEGLYRDYELWLTDTLKVIAQNNDVVWILKAHPSEKHMATNRHVREIVNEVYGGMLPANLRFLDADTHLNTYSLIDFSDAIVTVRGTIGFEAACKGKRVIAAGYGPFSGLGFSTEFSSKEEYRHCLMNLQAEETALSEVQIHFARMGLHGYFMKKAPVSKVMLRVGGGIENLASLTREELFSDATLNRFVDKMLSKTSGDLL